MTTGRWLIAVSRALLHHDTFDRMVAPAIADLQFRTNVTGYAAAVNSLLHGIADDLLIDVRIVCEDIGVLIGLVVIQACYYSGMLLLLAADMRSDEILDRLAHGAAPQLIVTIVCVLLLSALPTLFCFWPSRRISEPDL
jgi:hypothetical protein